MRIQDLDVARRTVRLRVPFVTALRSVSAIDCVLVRVTTDQGTVGFGEAAPAQAVTAETADGVEASILRHVRPALLGVSLEAAERVFEALDGSVRGNASAKAAVDMALYDLLAQRAAVPLHQYLGGYRDSLETDYTVSIATLNQMADAAARAVERGFKILKLKLGQAGMDEDFERVLRVREAVGPSVKLRLDPNQAWSPDETISVMGRIEDAGLDIEFLEQPVRAEDLDGLKRVSDAITTPVMADESVFGPEQAFEVLRRRAADFINIKLLKCGGIRRALVISDMAEICGVECMIGSMMETRLSVSAAAHFAASRKNVTRYDLDAPLMLEADGVDGGIRYEGALISLPKVPGLGIRNVTVSP